ncbi:MAG TPA: hypothetical protein VGU45_04935, partial [Microvirga sp.]|nr:hypothetical protein [Microvirga sp.]
FWIGQSSNLGVVRPSGNISPYQPNGDNPAIIRRSTDGGATWTDMGGSGWTEMHALGFGKAAPGQSFPALYALGARTGDTPSVYRSINMASSWTKLPGPYTEYPTGNYDALRFIDGDMDTYGDVWIGTRATGVIKGTEDGVSYTRIRFR